MATEEPELTFQQIHYNAQSVPFCGLLTKIFERPCSWKKKNTFKHYVKQGLMSRVGRYLSLLSFTAANSLASSEQTTTQSRLRPYVTFLAFLKTDFSSARWQRCMSVLMRLDIRQFYSHQSTHPNFGEFRRQEQNTRHIIPVRTHEGGIVLQ